MCNRKCSKWTIAFENWKEKKQNNTIEGINHLTWIKNRRIGLDHKFFTI